MYRKTTKPASHPQTPRPEVQHPKWADLLARAVSEPGLVNTAYTRFHNYSIGNQMLALVQCLARNLQPGPISTFEGWKRQGRFVQKGQKAIVLCMPVTVKDKNNEDEVFTVFVFKPHWFVLSQTEGEEMPALETPEWDADRALAALNVTEVPFEALNGNTMGYATNRREIAINPLNPMPWKTRFHEIAHVLLGHVAEGQMADAANLPKSLVEAEAESVAMLCLDALNLPGAEYSRDYIQHWLNGESIPEKSAARIFGAAERILKAGRPAAE